MKFIVPIFYDIYTRYYHFNILGDLFKILWEQIENGY